MIKFYLEKTQNTDGILNQLRKLDFIFETHDELVLCTCKNENTMALIKHEVYPTQELKMIIWDDKDTTVSIYMKEIWSVYNL